MSSYTPDLSNSIPLVLLVPTYTNSNGVAKKTYPTVEAALAVKDEKNNPVNLFFGTFKSYQGTEREVNGLYSILDTAHVETWFRPDITSDCRIARANDGAIFEIMNEPENINMRNQYLKFKIQRVKGKA